MSLSDGATEDGTNTTPAPITAPPAPRQLAAPHNLFTLAEIADALRLLTTGLREQAHVSAYWRSGGRKYLSVEEIVGITEVEDVHKIFVSWIYGDGSRVIGNLVHRPHAGGLSVEGGGDALAAAYACIDHLKGLRAQRARFRGFIGGQGLPWLYLLSALILLLAWFGIVSLQGLPALVPKTFTLLTRSLLGTIIGIAIGMASAFALRRLQRHVGGTRLARQHEVDRTFLNAEMGVFTAVIGVPIMFLTLVVAVITLLVDVT